MTLFSKIALGAGSMAFVLPILAEAVELIGRVGSLLQGVAL